MTRLTDRYLAAALRGIPEKQRDDVERELRSSIADAIEDRVRAGEDRDAAERTALEGLGDPTRLSAGMTGRPLYLIGPDLFLTYRQLLGTLLAFVIPIVAVIQVAVGVYTGEDWVTAFVSGAGVAFTVALHISFWVTIVFAGIERADSARDAREELKGGPGPWTVDRLPQLPAGRIATGETVGEVITTVITIGFIVILANAAWFTDAAGNPIPLLNPGLWSLWLPALILVLVLLTGLHVLVYARGRWTIPLAVVYTVLELLFAVPLVGLALTGSLINPAFAEALGWPELAEGSGWVMLVVAVSVVLVTAWEIIDAFRRARRADAAAAIGESGPVLT